MVREGFRGDDMHGVGTVRGGDAWGECLTWGLEIESPPVGAPCQWRAAGPGLARGEGESCLKALGEGCARFPWLGWAGVEEDSGLLMFRPPQDLQDLW